MTRIEQTISSIEVAEMVGKLHKNIVRDIRKYIGEMNELKIEPVEFFHESTYKDGKRGNASLLQRHKERL